MTTEINSVKQHFKLNLNYRDFENSIEVGDFLYLNYQMRAHEK